MDHHPQFSSCSRRRRKPKTLPTEKKEQKSIDKAAAALENDAKARGDTQSMGWRPQEKIVKQLVLLNNTAKKELADEQKVKEAVGDLYDDLQVAKKHLDTLVASFDDTAASPAKEEVLFMTNADGFTPAGRSMLIVILDSLKMMRAKDAIR
jgi:hypothetical protein